MSRKKFKINCTGDVAAGDTIRFEEAVFSGSFRKPKYIGDRTIEAEVLKDSYGAAKQQHTFTLKVIRSEGIQAVGEGETIRRKGRNIYKKGVFRQRWANETKREEIIKEKHIRGGGARRARALRRDRESEQAWPYGEFRIY